MVIAGNVWEGHLAVMMEVQVEHAKVVVVVNVVEVLISVERHNF